MATFGSELNLRLYLAGEDPVVQKEIINIGCHHFYQNAPYTYIIYLLLFAVYCYRKILSSMHNNTEKQHILSVIVSRRCCKLDFRILQS
jgi:hypothetical protein